MTTLGDLAKWVDQSLNETVKQTRDLRAARVMGVSPAGDGQFRTMDLLDSSSGDPYDLFNRPPDKSGYEALAIIMTGTMRQIIDDDTDGEPFAVRICAVINDDGVAVAVHRDDNDTVEVDVFADGGEGAFPDAMRAWWNEGSTLLEDA